MAPGPRCSSSRSWHQLKINCRPRKQASAFVEEQAKRCRLDPAKHDLGAVAGAVTALAHAAHDLRLRLASLEANPLLVAKKGAVAVDALAEARE